MGVVRRLVVVAVVLGLAAPAHAGVGEQWYVLRGRSNMKIGNYRAAIEAWQKALEANPANREASRALVTAYEKNGETDRGVAQADQHLARWPDDTDLAFQQARSLGWARYAYRRGDAVKYYRMGLARQDDPTRRHELARLLARERATLDDALAEYRTLLRADGGNRALRDEYLALLLWEPRHRAEAIAELERRVPEREGDAELHLQIARLAAAERGKGELTATHYRKALALRPDDRKLRLELARNLLRDRGRRDEALAEYEKALAGGGPGAQLAREELLAARIERAELLAADERRRDEATEAFAALSKEAPSSARVRLGYARILGGRKETTDAAIAQYAREVEARPRSAEGHAGLARSYAWEGDGDRALHHAGLALAADPRQPEVARLRDELRRGREPTVSAFQRVIARQGGQRAGEEGVLGVALGARAARDVTAFARATVDAGGERQSSEGRARDGGFAALRVEGRPSRETTLDLGLGWRGVREGDAAVLGALGVARRRSEDAGWRLRFDRRAREDSYVALAGSSAGTGGAAAQSGLATENAFTVGVTRPFAGAALDLAAEAGAVTHASSAANGFGGGIARLGRPLAAGGPFTLRGALELRARSYAEDHSALPGPGAVRADGYFSPALLVAPGAELAVAYELPFRHRLEVGLRPAAQHVRDRSGTAWQLGGDAWASWWMRAGERWALSAAARAGRTGGSYQRVDVEVGAGLVF